MPADCITKWRISGLLVTVSTPFKIVFTIQERIIRIGAYKEEFLVHIRVGADLVDNRRRPVGISNNEIILPPKKGNRSCTVYKGKHMEARIR